MRRLVPAWAVLSLAAVVLLSCEAVPLGGRGSFDPAASRLLLYIHSTSPSPPEVAFTIESIEIESADGEWGTLVDRTIDVDSRVLAAGQRFLGESFVRPGAYKAVRLVVSRASTGGEGERVSLALPEPEGTVVFTRQLKLERGESTVLSFAWDADRSIEKGYRFSPDIAMEVQVHSARGLLLFVSNSGSNYLSIIDRSLERVVGAVTVGSRPMGMALNETANRIYVVGRGSGEITVVDAVHLQVLDRIVLTTGVDPTDIAFMPEREGAADGKLYIVNRISNDVTVVSTTARRVIGVIPVGMRPAFIASDPERRELYVVNERSNDLHIISAVDDRVVAVVPVDQNPGGVAVKDGSVYVFCEGANRINIVSPSQRKVVSTFTVVDPPRRGAVGFGGRLFVANTAVDTLTFFNTLNVPTRTIPAGPGPIAFAGDERRNRLYISNFNGDTVSVADPFAERLLKELRVGENPYGLLILDR